MQIFSPPGLHLAGMDSTPAPLLFVSGLGAVDLRNAFVSFATFVQQRSDSLCQAMSAGFVDSTKFAVDVPAGELYQSIRSVYDDKNDPNVINIPGNGEKLFRYNLYLYIAINHFSCWYVREKRSETVNGLKILDPTIREYVKKQLSSRHYQGDVEIAPEFFETDEFRDAFAVDGTLRAMVGASRLGDVAERTLLGARAFLMRGGKRLGMFEGQTARAVKREFVQVFRETITDLVDHDVRQFLAKLNVPSSPTGLTLLRGYGQYRQFGVGNGTTTKAMFGVVDYGLLFFNYDLNDLRDLTNPCNSAVNQVTLIDERDPGGTKACLLYYGLDVNFTSQAGAAVAPKVNVTGCDSQVKRAIPDASFKARNPASHELTFDAGHDPGNLSLGAFKATALKADLISSDAANPEELIYIVFKHRIGATDQTLTPPPPAPPMIRLTSEWWLPDNMYRKTPAEESAEVFSGQASIRAALVAALESDNGFEIYSSIRGLGVGHVIDGVAPNSGEIQLERYTGHQADVGPPDKAEHDALRYAHGRVDWYGDSSGTGGWLIFYVNGFVSPLRATLEENMPAGPLAALQTLIKPRLPKDKLGRTSYNCALSALRAFFLFDAMLRMILAEALSSGQFNRINAALTNHRDNEAEVKILLPNDAFAPGPPIKWADLAPFK